MEIAFRMADDTKRFGRLVRKHRARQGLSQERLAELAGLDRTYVGGIERGERNPSLRNIAKLASALGLSIRDLFSVESSD